ncbi:hypothetical protein ABZU76_31600 [Amycolatopsis sp. NPDC005232]|uniref:hypothetical protein n=1 Tax=Amycolatopsis sp. NPDC005232 TaxID=3157027 RepID=UPI0033BB8C75
MTYLDLVSFHLSGQGVSVVKNEQEIGGVTVAMPRPYLPIGGLGVAPALEPTANGVLGGIDYWTGMCVLPEHCRVLPPLIRRDEQAVQAAREFSCDPGIDTTSPATEIRAWRAHWGEQQRAVGRS